MQSLPKALFVFVLCVPLAVILGVMLATPLDRNTMFLVLAGFLLLLTPILLKYHHTALILSWNTYVNAFFLPGQPYIWMLMTAISTFFIVLISTVNRGNVKMIYERSVAWPLIFLLIVTMATAKVTGGVGTQVLGSEVYGGKRYLFLWGAIVAFFALSAIPVNPKHRQFLAGIFFLSGITAVASNMAFMLGERFYFLFLLFPAEWAITQAASEYSIGGFTRIGGLAPASAALVSFLLVRFGLEGCFEIRRPWRVALLAGGIAASLFSGFRASVLLVLMFLFVQFLIEGLHRTKFLAVFSLIFILSIVALVPMANKLPHSVQRCLTVFPIDLDLDRNALEAARGSTEWRLEMWRAIIPDVPKYLLVGKGYALDPKDMYFSQAHISLRAHAPYEASLVAGDYHSGPLTLVIPFGIWGVIGFLWFYIAGFKVLRKNLLYGDESIKNINRFLMTFFIVKMIFFISIFGAFYMDLVSFVGAVALSICMNHGVARAPAPAPAFVPARAPEPSGQLTWQPAFRRRTQGI